MNAHLMQSEFVSNIFPKDESSIQTSNPIQRQPIDTELVIQSKERLDSNYSNQKNFNDMKRKSIESKEEMATSIEQIQVSNGFLQNTFCYNLNYAVMFFPWLYQSYSYIIASLIIIMMGTISILIQSILQQLFLKTKQVLFKYDCEMRMMKVAGIVFDSRGISNILQIVLAFNDLFYSVMILNFTGVVVQCIGGIYNQSFNNKYVTQVYLVCGIVVLMTALLTLTIPKVKQLPTANIVSILSFMLSAILIAAYTQYQDDQSVKPDSSPKTLDSTNLQSIVSLSSVMLVFFSQSQKEAANLCSLEHCQRHYVCVYGTLLLTFIYVLFGTLSYYALNPFIMDGQQTFEYAFSFDSQIPQGLTLFIYLMLLVPALFQLWISLGVSIQDLRRLLPKQEWQQMRRRFQVILALSTNLLVLILAICSKDIVNIIILLGSTSTCFLYIILPCLLYMVMTQKRQENKSLKYGAIALFTFGMAFSATSVTASILLIQKLFF